MRQGRRFRRLGCVLGVVLGMAGLGLAAAALVDAGGAHQPVRGHASPDWSQRTLPTTARISPSGAAAVDHAWGDSRSGGGTEVAQSASHITVAEHEERLRFLYRTAAAARKLPWMEVQRTATQSYVGGTVPPEFQMMGSMSPNP